MKMLYHLSKNKNVNEEFSWAGWSFYTLCIPDRLFSPFDTICYLSCFLRLQKDVSCFHYMSGNFKIFLKGQLIKPYFDFKRRLSTLLCPQNGLLLKITVLTAYVYIYGCLGCRSHLGIIRYAKGRTWNPWFPGHRGHKAMFHAQKI